MSEPHFRFHITQALGVVALVVALAFGLSGLAANPAAADDSQWVRSQPHWWDKSTGWNRSSQWHNNWNSSQYGGGTHVVIGGSGVFLSSPGYSVVSPAFVVRQPGFAFRQPNFVYARPSFALKQKQFIQRHPSLRLGQPWRQRHWQHRPWKPWKPGHHKPMN